jgi:hypothetical protein
MLPGVRPRNYGSFKPPIDAALDWGHPLARGLVSAFLCNGGAPPRDLVTGTQLIPGTSSARGNEGGFYSGTGGGTNGAGAVAPSQLQLTTHTFLWRGRHYGGENITLPYFGLLFDNANSSPFFSAGIGPDSNVSADNVCVFFNNGSTFVDLSINVSLSTRYNKPLQFVGCYKPGFQALYDNGVLVGSGTDASVTTYGATAPFCMVGNIYSNNQWTNAEAHLGLMWNRILTAAEVAWLQVEPYAMFVPPKMWVRRPPSGVVNIGWSAALKATPQSPLPNFTSFSAPITLWKQASPSATLQATPQKPLPNFADYKTPIVLWNQASPSATLNAIPQPLVQSKIDQHTPVTLWNQASPSAVLPATPIPQLPNFADFKTPIILWNQASPSATYQAKTPPSIITTNANWSFQPVAAVPVVIGFQVTYTAIPQALLPSSTNLPISAIVPTIPILSWATQATIPPGIPLPKSYYNLVFQSTATPPVTGQWIWPTAFPTNQSTWYPTQTTIQDTTN